MNNLEADSNIPNYEEVEALICDARFQAYCLGLDSQAQVYWEQWRQDNPDKETIFLQARRIVEILSARQGNRQAELGKFKQGLQQAETFKQHFNPRKPARKIWVWTAAAGLLFAVGLGWSLYKYLPESGSRISVLRSENQSLVPTPPQSPVQYTTGGLDKRTVLLSDGSTVTLRDDAVLTVLPDFGNRERNVRLQGEAYFRVSHLPDMPFLVQTDLLTTKVLGTEFNIQQDDQRHQTRVLLLKGKVEVALNRKPQETVLLLPNQVYQTSDGLSGEIQAVKAEESVPEIQWMKTRFQVENMPLKEIAVLLEDTYGVRILFEEETTKEYRYTGTFETEGLLEALNALQLSYPFQYEISGQTIRIRP